MKKYKISSEEFNRVSYKRLANSPGANSTFGESRLTGEALKARMDEPFELFMAKFNLLVSLIVGTSDGDSLTKNIPTGINDTHTLYDLILDITSEGAEFASYLSVGDKTLLEALKSISDILDGHEKSKENPHEVTAKQIGLGNADNTSDEDKPLSAAAREAVETLRTEIKNNKEYTDNNFVGRSGSQAIDGELAVKRLYVEGTTYSTDLGSLNVKDRFICANSDGVPMAGLTGFVLRVNGGEAYGIVHDTAGRCVKIGLGVYDSDSGEFVFKDGEAQALATRGEISNGEIPVWDNEKSTFKGSGIKAKDIEAQHAGFARRNEVAGALKGSASGEAVVLESVSPIEHSLGVKVSSKNLLDFKNITIAYNPASGITYNKSDTAIEINNDGNTYNGSVTFNVPMTDDMWGKTLTLSYKHEAVGMRIAQISLFFNKGGTQVFSGNALNGVGTFKAPNKGEADSIQIRFTCYLETSGVAGSITYSDVQVEKGTTATYPRPYVADVSAVKLRVQGGNLLDSINAPMFGSWSEEYYRGWRYEKTKTGFMCTIDAGATITSARMGYLCIPIAPIRGKTLTVSFKRYSTLDDTNTSTCAIVVASDTEIKSDYTYIPNALDNKKEYKEFKLNHAVNGYFTASFTVSADETRKYLFIQIYLGYNAVAVQDSVVEYSDIQIELDEKTEYELYIPPIEYSIGDDIRSICPTTTLTTDTVGVLIEVEYNRDINKAFEKLQNAIISLGGYL